MIEAIRRRLHDSLLARNTLWMLGGQSARIFVQGLYFVALARALGPDGYGAFAAVLALVSVATPFASLGCGSLLVKNVARNPGSFGQYWGNGVTTALVGGSLLGVASSILARVLLPATVPTVLIVCVAVSDLVFLPLVEVCGQGYQALHRLERTARIQLQWSLLKLAAAAGIFFGLFEALVSTWGPLYLASTLLCAILTVWEIGRERGSPRLGFHFARGELREGAYFSAGGSARAFYDDIDKTLLARLATLEATGVYGAAYRVIDLTFLPIRSLLYASYPVFFQHGEGGIGGALRFARRLVLVGVSYGAVAACGLLLVAPMIPVVLGASYSPVAEAVRWLAPLPLLKAGHYFVADALSGAGHQGARTATQIGVGTLNIALNFALIPAYGWRGAAWASLASNGLLAALLWVLALRLALSTAGTGAPAPQPVA